MCVCIYITILHFFILDILLVSYQDILCTVADDRGFPPNVQ